MKRSEYERARTEAWAQRYSGDRSWTQCVRDDVAAAEAAGVVWDPEEEPMAERLYPVTTFDGVSALWTTPAGTHGGRLATLREAVHAADLYGRRGCIAEAARELRRLCQPGAIADMATLLRLADRLEGK